MARMPGAKWRPVSNCTPGGQESVHGVVLHIMEGTLAGTDAWFHNGQAQASSHFGVGKDGTLYQWVDTSARAWAQSAGNRTWLSIEHEGHSGDSLTPRQLAATARVVAWMHDVHDVPLRVCDDPGGRGIGWHGMGGAAWGGHYNCPGTPIKDQRPEIIRAAGGSAPPAGGGGPSIGLAHLVAAAKRDPGLPQGGTTHAAEVKVVEAALAAAGLLDKEWVDGSFGTRTREAYAAWQRRLGYTGADADGVPGRASLTQLGRLHGFTVTA